MTGTTISNSSTIGITLSTTYTAIDTGVSISVSGGTAIYGPSGASSVWTLFNQGAVYGADSIGAVALSPGGVVTNAASGVISGSQTGIVIQNGTGTVINAGGISAPNFGVKLNGGGSVTNTGTIRGALGIKIYNGAGTVTNSGQINGAGSGGIYLRSGGSITNSNSGTISDSSGTAVKLSSGGGVFNQGYIHGGNFGIYSGGGTINNFGTIKGGNEAIHFNLSGGRVVDNPGAVFIGTVVGFQHGGAMTLELASGASAGTVSGIGNSFTNFTSVLVDAGAHWAMTGSNYVTASQGAAANLTNSGTLTVTGSLYDTGAAYGTGEIDIAAGATVDLQSTVAAGQRVTFLAGTGTLGIGSTAHFAGTVYGLQSGDVIDFTTLNATGSITAGVSSSHLMLTQGATTLASIAVDPNQNFHGLYFDAMAGTGSVVVTGTTTPCFCAGTLIRTVRGDVAVEDLNEGDLVVTASGRQRPIRWIGRRSYKGYFVRGNRDVLPICIKAGALADNVPSRDLMVSPLHAMFVGGFLIPAFKLVNGVTVVQLQDVDEVRYFHVELDSHDILLAEDAPTESFVDDDSRDLFHNAPDYWAKHPRQPWRPARFCAPRVEDGYELEEAIHPLLIRAGLRHPSSSPYGDPLGELRGWVEECSPTRIAGWAQNMEFPHAGVVLSIFLGDEKLADVMASKQRADLEEAGIGDGRHGFEYRPKQPIPTARLHTVRVVRAMDREALPGQTHGAVAA